MYFRVGRILTLVPLSVDEVGIVIIEKVRRNPLKLPLPWKTVN